MVLHGLIRPPPEIRVVADRTALYVAKNGRTFETRILQSAKGQTPKFAFLHTTSPFHAYYEDRIQYYENGGGDAESEETKEGTTSSNVDETNTEAAAAAVPPLVVEEDDRRTMKQNDSAIDPIAKALLSQRMKIAEFYKRNTTTTNTSTNNGTDAAPVVDTTTTTTTTTVTMDGTQVEDSTEPITTTATTTPSVPPPPPPITLSLLQIIAPSSLSMIQLETIQTTAQFIALSRYSQSSSSYSTFHNNNLLQELTLREWNNPIFQFCQPRHGHFPYFSALVDAYTQILTDWGSSTTVVNTSSPASVSSVSTTRANLEINAMANNVDHCLDITAYRAEYQRNADERLRHDDPNNSTANNNRVDWHDFVLVETIDFNVNEVVANLPPPSTLQQQQQQQPILPYTMKSRNDSDMENDDDDDDGETIHVVPTYTPKISGAMDATGGGMTVIDPISGQAVAVQDMPEHLRIQLLDPKWAEERKRFQDKQKESNLVSGDMVASNLERFAQARGDRFGKKEQNVLSQEAESKKRLEEANRIIREQGDTQRTVGPILPGQPPPLQQQKHSLVLPPPIAGGAVDEPVAKRSKIVTYAPSVLQPPVVPPLPTVVDDPFTFAATGGAVLSTSLLDNQDLIPEAEFAASLPKLEMTLQIRVPNDPTQMAWNFYGQIVSISTNVMTQIKVLKSELSSLHLNGLPSNKIQLKNPATGSFLKDNFTLAAHNISPSTTLELVPRARGGKKK